MNRRAKDSPIYALAAFCFVFILGNTFVATSLMADPRVVSTVQAEDHKHAIEAWRASRHERLKQPDGWLSLTGLEWLVEGESRIGSAADNAIQLSGGPAYWGSVALQNDRVHFKNFNLEKVKVNGESLPYAELLPDTEGVPTVVSSGTLSFNVIFRESFALRIKDSKAITLLNFKGVDNYPIDESWRIEGRFVPEADGNTMEITNVLGQVSASPVFGTFEFDMNGKSHSLMALGDAESESLWFIFADRTTGHGTYGAGRYLYSEGMPEDGRLTVDFNKAYNPPCAFNDYSTCPIPPQRNRMDLFVLAGEKIYYPESDQP